MSLYEFSYETFFLDKFYVWLRKASQAIFTNNCS